MKVTVTDFWVIEEIAEQRPVVAMLDGVLRREVVEGPFGLEKAVSHAKTLNSWVDSATPRRFHVASTTREMVVEMTAGKMIEAMMRESGQ